MTRQPRWAEQSEHSEHTLTSAGVTLVYDARGSGAPVVQLHGLTSSRQRDVDLHLDLTAGCTGLAVTRYDAAGHGASLRGAPEDPARYTWPALAADLLALLDIVSPDAPVHAVGQSMGAATILTAALQRPERFASLSLALPPTAWEVRAARIAHYERTADLIATQGVAAFRARDAATPLPPAVDPHRTDHGPDVPSALLPTVFRGAAASNLPARDALAHLGLPALVLAWGEDPAHPESVARELVCLLPSAHLVLAASPADVAAWPELIGTHVRAAEASVH